MQTFYFVQPKQPNKVKHSTIKYTYVMPTGFAGYCCYATKTVFGTVFN